MQSMFLNYVLITALIITVGGAGTVSLLMYRALDQKGETAMTKMKLHSEKTFKEFKALFYAHLIQTIGLFILGIGASLGSAIAVHIGRASTIIQGAVTITVVYRWWKRFK